jgi:hypothetical protein
MLATAKPEADFSAGCACTRIGYLLFATHPHRSLIRELTLGDKALVAHRSRFMQNRSYGVSRMHLPRRLVNKPAVNAPDPS